MDDWASTGFEENNEKLPDEPWEQKNWNDESPIYKSLCVLYSKYFAELESQYGSSNVLLGFVMANLWRYVKLESVSDTIQVSMLKSFVQPHCRFMQREEFVKAMFFLSFATVNALHSRMFYIVSMKSMYTRICSVIKYYVIDMQHVITSSFLKIFSAYRSDYKMDEYVFCNIMQEIEKYECELRQVNNRNEDDDNRRLLDALIECNEVEICSWDPYEFYFSCSSRLRNLVQCREALVESENVAHAVALAAWSYPEILDFNFITALLKYCVTAHEDTDSSSKSDLDFKAKRFENQTIDSYDY